jgi:hypothetical protein
MASEPTSAYCHECGRHGSVSQMRKVNRPLQRGAVYVCRDDRECEDRERERRGQPPRYR